jgi:4-amino-4-deoxy-L-arabinose transferase-like glycosyltransferase
MLVFAAILLIARAPLPLLEPEEARYAEIPRQMASLGRWLVPIRDGQDYLDKPPLLYWLVSASYSAFGVHDWAARLPTLAATWFTIGIVLGWGWRAESPGAGVAAALTLTLAGDFLYRAPMLTMNGPLALFVTASLAAGHVARLQNFTGWWLTSGVACGLGMMMKGPIAIALVGPPLLTVGWFDRRARQITFWHGVTWTAAVVAVAAPWFIAVAIERPEFIEYFFWRHHIQRFATPFDHAGPIWQYVPQLTVGMFPWSLLVVGLLLRDRRRNGSVKMTPIAMFGFAAAIWGFALFSFSGSKRPVYLVPIYPPLAVAIGTELWRLRLIVGREISMVIVAAVSLAIVIGTLGWMPRYTREFSIAEVVKAVNDVPANVPIVCYGQSWDSVGFYLQRNNVVTLLGERRAELTSIAGQNERTLVFISNKSAGDDFAACLPPGRMFVPIAENRQTRVGWINSPTGIAGRR